MVTVLPKAPGFGERIGTSVGEGFQQGASQGMQFAQQMALDQAKQKKETKDLAGTFGTILEEMKSLKKNVGPLNLAALNPFSETSGKRSQINTLRLSLEGLFRDLTLKGQFPKAIYERILKELPQASDTETQYLNHIEGVEKILNAHYSGESEGKKTTETISKNKEKFLTMKDPSGALRKVPSNQVNDAKSAGYKVIK